MRDFVILFVHLIATVARIAGSGGVRSVVAESVLVKQQLLILNRSRKRAPKSARNRSDHRWFVRTVHATGAYHPFRNRAETVNAAQPPSNVSPTKVPLAVFTQMPTEARPERTKRRTHCSGCRNETA